MTIWDFFTQWRRKRQCERDGHFWTRPYEASFDGAWTKRCRLCDLRRTVKRRAKKEGAE